MLSIRTMCFGVFLSLCVTHLTAAVAPTITTQTSNKTVTLGSTATFTVVASGTAPLSYQWSKKGTAISGATAASYTTPATVTGDNGATFTVKVSNSAGSVTSSAATLTLNLPPAITTQPINKSVNVGSTATFTVVASGTGTLSYQWSKNGTAISGATSASYITPATVFGDNASTFTVNVANSYGNITSSPATLAVMVVPPSIMTSLTNQTVALGATATFTVVSSGTAPFIYQWSKNGTDITGATSTSYTTPAIVATDNGAIFTVIVTNTAGSSRSSATLTLGLPPTITSQPTHQYAYAGDTGWFQVNASGMGSLTYQWSKNGTAIPGATSSTYTTPPTVVSDNGSIFTVQVTNLYGNINSSPILLTVLTRLPSITNQPANQTVTLGSTATFAVVTSGTAPLTYQWSKNGAAISGATAASYTTPPTVSGDGGSIYSVTVRNDYGSVTSSNVGLFFQTPAVQVIPARTTVSLGGTIHFQALVQSGSVTWSVIEANGGTISQDGAYQAPSIAGSYTIKAVSTTETSLFGFAKVIVDTQPAGPPITGDPGVTGVRLTLTPGTLQVDAATGYPFLASATGSDNQAVGWQVVGNPTDAKIDQDGLFVAHREGLYQVEAVSAADSTATVVAQVYVQSAVHTVSDNPLTVLRGYSVTVLQNGKVLIAGGSTPTDPQASSVDQISSQAYIYDPSTQVFTQTGSMLIGRTDHKATLLPDGRVLITSGLGVYQEATDISYGFPAKLQEVNCAEVYDPNLAAFVQLPSPGFFTVNSTPPVNVAFPSGYMYLWLLNKYLWADTLCLSNGDTILLPGGDTGKGVTTHSGATQVYTAATGIFDSYANVSGTCEQEHLGLLRYDPCKFFTGSYLSSYAITITAFNVTTPPKCGVGVVLNDGRGIAIGGIDCLPSMNETLFLWWRSSLAGSALGAWDSVNVYNPGTCSWSALAPMNVPRGRHTATKLADGRVLVVGGGTGTSPDLYGRVENMQRFNNGWREVPLIDTPTAEIYDPTANSWTMVGSLSQSRQGHAAVLLPTGQVMILGGRHYVQGGYPNATYTYPNDIEIFDPETNTFSVMDHLDYGLSEPKLALLPDGSVFVAGQVQAPMEPPVAQSQQQGMMSNTLMAMDVLPTSTTLTAGSTVCGSVSSAWFGFTPKSASVPVQDPNTAIVKLVSRCLDITFLKWWQYTPLGKAVGWFEHAGWVIEEAGNSFVVQAGPETNTEQGKDVNIASVTPLDPGKGMEYFSMVTDSDGEAHKYYVSTIATYQMDASVITKEKLENLRNIWNSKNITYVPKGGPNSNTFAHWLGVQLNASPLLQSGFGLIHPLWGWSYPLP